MLCAIILAAGRSERMGAQKLLLPFAQSTVIERVVDAFLHASVGAAIVVTRQGDKTIRDALGVRSVVHVENPDPDADMLSSLRCGIRALPPGATALLISPGDQPSLTSTLVRQVIEAFEQSRAKILVPVCQGRRGHPLVFDARYCPEVLTSFKGVGLLGLMETHASDVFEWPTSSEAVLEDLDTPADYRKALRGKPG